MQTVELVIADIGWLITVDPGRRIIRDAAIAVDQGKIVAIGKSAEVGKGYTGKKTVSGRNTVATPGFVDCHLHSSFQLSRGLADEANAQSFLFDRMYPYEAALGADDVRVSATLAATELLKHGVTCFIDPGNYHPESSVEGVMSTGIRMIVSRSSFDLTKSVLGLLPERMIETTATALERAEAVLEKYARSGNPRLGASASFRGLNNASDELIVVLDKLAKKYGTLLQTHACFSYSTHDSSIARAGIAEMERLDKLGVIDDHMLVVHSGWLEPAGGGDAGARKPSLVCAPFQPPQRLRQFRLRQTAGADGSWRQRRDRLRPRDLRHRRHDAGGPVGLLLLQGDAPQSARHAAGDRHRDGDDQWRQRRRLCRIGSAASRWARRPYRDNVDINRPEWQPLINPLSNLVYSATGDSVRDVFVAGEHVVERGRLLQEPPSSIWKRAPPSISANSTASPSTSRPISRARASARAAGSWCCPMNAWKSC